MDAQAVSELRSRLESFQQGHLLQFWEQLDDVQKQSLFDDLSSIDLRKVTDYYKRTTRQTGGGGGTERSDESLRPVPDELSGSVSRMKSDEQGHYNTLGLQAISEGKVAALLLAGGQGTRLGVPYPKGMYDVGLLSSKPLYQLQAERILRLQHLAKKQSGVDCTIPWYIMTSEHTKGKTEEFFVQHDHFGLNASDVVIFEQDMLPCFAFDGKIILESTHQVARAPNGNGGLYQALGTHGIVTDMRQRGITCMHVYGVDNILVKVCDPVFIGFCQTKNADCGAKVVKKAFPTEPVGVICQVDNHFEVVEYSEITLQTAEKRRADGQLVYNAGNICNHYFTTDFVESVIDQYEDMLSHHVAKKKIPSVRADGTPYKPSVPNGIKMEKFVFDIFQFSQQFAVLEVLREDEFSPLKNGPSAEKDSPQTCCQALQSMHYRWVLAAGGKFVDGAGSVRPLIPPLSPSARSQSSECCEVSPLVSYAGEGLSEKVAGKSFLMPILFDADGMDLTSGDGVQVKCISNGNGSDRGEPAPKASRLA
eukprot:scpid50080/ scgid26590/ UDP-N-acetylhexosamine pyrophosphorylase; UDP-N-acetylgalactosamine pyrophosphorylase; UDP-N-acetylglucosamine pyrophosphorylase